MHAQNLCVHLCGHGLAWIKNTLKVSKKAGIASSDYNMMVVLQVSSVVNQYFICFI